MFKARNHIAQRGKEEAAKERARENARAVFESGISPEAKKGGGARFESFASFGRGLQNAASQQEVAAKETAESTKTIAGAIEGDSMRVTGTAAGGGLATVAPG